MHLPLLHTVFEERAAQFPGHPAIDQHGTTISYAALNERANGLAHLLREAGVTRDVVAGVMMPSGIGLVQALLAVFKAGGIYLPVNVAFPRQRLQQVFSHSGMEVLVTSAAQWSQAEATLRELEVAVHTVILLDETGAFRLFRRRDGVAREAALGAYPRTNPEVLSEGGDGNYIFYTSGSTGEAKAILGCHRSLSHIIQWELDEFGPAAAQRVSQLAQITFDASLRDVFLPLSSGGTLCIPPPEARANMALLAGWLAESRVTLVHCVPSLFRLLTRQLAGEPHRPCLPHLRHVLMAGESLFAKDIAAWREAVGEHAELVNLYGATETTLVKTCHRIKELPADPSQAVHAGKAISGAFIAIINGNNQLCRIGEKGEIYIKTPFASKGYYRNPELTRQAFVQNPLHNQQADLVYKTGDLGKYLPDRSIQLLGRLDDQVKVSGVRVELKAIESAALRVSGVQQAVVVAHLNHQQENELVCYYAGAAQPGDLQAELAQTVPVLPAYYCQLDAFPLTLNGKVDKRALPKPEQLLLRGVDYQPVTTPTEAVVESIWQGVLALPRVGRKGVFFQLGGTSLKAMQVIARLYRQLGVNLPVSDLFAYPTLAGLAGRIDALREAGGPGICQPIDPLGAQADYPLSHAQKRLWLLDQLEPGSTAYNMAGAYRIGGALDRPAFERALGALIARHESLRTVFVAQDGQPRQQVKSPQALGFAVAFADLRDAPGAEEKARIAARAQAAARFDLAGGPLLAVGLLQVAEHEHVLLLTMHHIISDGWSMGVLLREVLALYEAFRQGGANPLPPLPVQYKDYAAWHNGQVAAPGASQHYWLEQLAGELPVLALPADFPRPARKTYRGDSVRWPVGEPLAGRVKAFSREQGVSVFMTLLASVYALLYRYSGQTDLIVGTPIAGREHPDLAGQIGCFVNTLALRTRFEADDSFSQLLEKVKATALEAYRHQAYPFDKLVEDLAIPRDTAHSPLFDVMVVLQNPEPDSRTLGELTIRPCPTPVTVSKFDLRFNFIETDAALELQLDYNPDLFSRERVEGLVTNYQGLLAAVLENGQVGIARADYLSPAEKHRVLAEFNRTEAAYPADKTLVDLFEQQAAACPGRVAVSCEDRSLTYGALNARVNRLAHCLRGPYGVRPGDVVAVLLERSERMVIALLAIQKAGGAYLPIDPDCPRERVAYLLADAGVKAVVTDDRPGVEDNELRAYPCFAFGEDEDSLEGYPAGNPGRVNEPGDLAYVIYTSGSTGQPKGVMVAHQGAVNRVYWQWQHYGFTPDDVVLQKTPYVFDVSVWEFFMTLCFGARLVLCRKEVVADPDRLVAHVERFGVTTLHFVPSMFSTFLHAIEADHLAGLRTLRRVLTSGEALPAESVRLHYRKLPVPLHNLYGPTEASVDVSYYPAKAEDTVVPIGKPIANTQLYVLDAHRQPVPVGVSGEICIGGVGLAKGYLNKPALTAEKFVENPFRPGERLYRTGDLGRWLPDGNVEYLGRNDHQVKIRGYRIELGEIENVLLRHGQVKQAVVVARQDKDRGKYLAGYVAGEGELDANALKTFLKNFLPEYMVPAFLVPLAEMPLTVSGKIDRKALPDPRTTGAGTPDVYAAPGNDLEEKLVAIWEEVLDRKPIGVLDNFFEIGGHSLKATQVVSRIYKGLSRKIDLISLFTHPTVRGLAGLMAGSAATAYRPIEAVAEQPSYEVSHAQKRLWILNQLEPAQSVYNMAGAYVLELDVNRAAFEGAFAALVARHESLRTVFAGVDGEPRQVIRPAAEAGFAMAFEDLRGAADGETLARAAARREANHAFDLEKGPLLRARLLQLADARYVFLFTLHHIISDGWSMGVLLQEILARYEAGCRGEAPAPAPLRVQYKDYAAWQHAQLSGEAAKVHEAYWMEQLAGELPVLALPTDFPRPAEKTYRGDYTDCRLDEATTRGLYGLGQAQGASLFMTLLASVKVLLYKYTGQTDLVIGSPIAGRNHPDLEAQIGFYVNTLALRTRFDAQDSFARVLDRVREGALGAFAHQVYPFDQLVDRLSPTRDLSRSPLFDVMVVLQNAGPDEDRVAPGFKAAVKPFPAGGTASPFDLTFTFHESGDGLRVRLEYNTGLFSPAGAGRMLANYCRLLAAILENRQLPVRALAYVAPAQQQQLLTQFNPAQSGTAASKGVVTRFEKRARYAPEAIALVCEGRTLTYHQLNEKANRLAHCLVSRHGVQPDGLVGLLVNRSEEMIVAMLGILKSGAAYVPIDAGYPSERVAFMLRDTGVPVLVTEAGLAAGKGVTECRVLCLDADRETIAAHAGTNPGIRNEPGHLAYVIYTSGSTGQPKGVMIEHRSLAAYTDVFTRYFRLSGKDVVIQQASLAFDTAVEEIFPTLAAGGTLVVLPEGARDVDKLVAAIEREKATLLSTTPLVLNEINHQSERIKSLRTIISGGDELKASYVDELLERADLYNTYGPTETTVCALYHRVTSTAQAALIGQPIAGSTVYIVDEAGGLVPVGVPGELWIGGAGVARGYLNRPGLTAEKFVASPFRAGERLYKTGDVGRWLPNGTVEYLGRKDGQVKIRGNRVELTEVESALAAHPGVQEAVVVAREDGPAGKQLVAYLTARAATAPAAPALRNFLGERLPAYMVPAYFVVLDRLPLTANGKMDRRALPAPDAPGLAPDSSAVAPRNPREAQLLAIWRQVLGRDDIGVEDNFFQTGGHSLKATRVVSRIRKELQAQVELKHIFTHPTVAQLAEVIAAAETVSFAPIPAVPPQPSYELSRAQKSLWLVNQLDDASGVYNIPGAFTLNGALDQAAFAQAFAALVERHESLRTVIGTVDNEPRQVIRPAGADAVPLLYSDLRQHPDAGLLAQRAAREMAAAPFDLAAGPLVRARLLRLGEAQHVFLFTLHHIIADGWSLDVLAQEMAKGYNAFRRGEANPLAPLRIQYKDYAAWHNAQLAAGPLAGHRAYWEGQLAGAWSLVELPTDFARPAEKTHRGNTLAWSLDPATGRGLHALSEAQDTTLFMTLHAAVRVLLYYYTRQPDVVIGTPITGRHHADLEDQIGFFLNTLLLRNPCRGEERFSDFLAAVKRTTLDAYAHQLYPFDDLAEDLRETRGQGELFNVMLVVENAETAPPPLDGLTISPCPGEATGSKYDLRFGFAIGPEGIAVQLTYNCDLYAPARMELLKERLSALLTALVQSPETRIDQLLESLEYAFQPGDDSPDFSLEINF